jgi:anti-sigma factor RsiW
MSCESYDWKGYALGELAATDRREAEAHAATCEGCRGELAQVRMTVDTLAALREEEVPRRIAFVSDKVFEPRWWETFLRPAFFSPLFAAACVLAAAIVAHGYMMRPQAVDDAAIQARVNQAVVRAVADVERHNAELETQLTAFYVKSTGIKYQ